MEHRFGNNEADTCAIQGIHEAATNAERRAVTWLLRRRALYALCFKDVNMVIISVLKSEKGTTGG